jgi:hypothetical protein
LEVSAEGLASEAQRDDVVGDHRGPEATSPANRLLAEYLTAKRLMLGVVTALLELVVVQDQLRALFLTRHATRIV